MLSPRCYTLTDWTNLSDEARAAVTERAVVAYLTSGSYADAARQVGLTPKHIAMLVQGQLPLPDTTVLPTITEIVADTMLMRERAENIEIHAEDQEIALKALALQDRMTRRLQTIALLGYQSEASPDEWIIDTDLVV